MRHDRFVRYIVQPQLSDYLLSGILISEPDHNRQCHAAVHNRSIRTKICLFHALVIEMPIRGIHYHVTNCDSLVLGNGLTSCVLVYSTYFKVLEVVVRACVFVCCCQLIPHKPVDKQVRTNVFHNQFVVLVKTPGSPGDNVICSV